MDGERLKDLPSRCSEGCIRATKDVPDFVIHLSPSRRDNVYNKYYDYALTTAFGMRKSLKRRMLDAHHFGLIGVAYLECRCKHCRFVSWHFAPHSWDTILASYEAAYDTVVPSEVFFYRRSHCLIVKAFRDHEEALGGEVGPYGEFVEM